MEGDHDKVLILLDNERLVRIFLSYYRDASAPGLPEFLEFLEVLMDNGKYGLAAQYVLLCHAQGAAEDVSGIMAITQHLCGLPAVSEAVAWLTSQYDVEAN